ncbi:MAG: hypothetical protein KGN02_00085 [bacterium]|nr:hypothetical protein [bacterium]
MTTLFERYLHAVGEALPKDVVAADVTAEIADDLHSRAEEREAELGRELTDEEAAAILREYGDPRVVAARYGRVQSLIGPELLPYYWSTLTLALVVVVALELVVGGISAIVRADGLRFFSALDVAVHSLVWVFTIVTVIFAAAERVPQGRQRLARVMRWDPRALAAPSALPPVARSSSLAEFIANTLALLVLLDARGAHRVPLDRLVATMLSDLHLTLTVAWQPALVGTAVGAALVAIAAMIAFLRPQAAVVHEMLRMLGSVVAIVGLAMTLASGPLFDPGGGIATTIGYVTLGAAIAVLAVQAVLSVRALLVRAPMPTPKSARG